jgi:hypothetical protein
MRYVFVYVSMYIYICIDIFLYQNVYALIYENVCTYIPTITTINKWTFVDKYMGIRTYTYLNKTPKMHLLVYI